MAESTDGYSVDRRTVLQGAGAAALTGITVSTTSVAGEENDDEHDEDDNLLVLIYDDSPREDYTKAFPVHQEYDVPGCVAICPGFVGSDSRWMHQGHVNELHEAGWEVMSHTLMHRALGEIPVRSDIEEGDTEIHVQSSLHGQYSGDPLVIFNDDTEVTATSAGRNDTGDEAILALEEPIEEDIEIDGEFHTWVRYTDEFTEEILEESKAQIEEWGFGPVTAYVHTYNRYDGFVSELVPEYYDVIPNRHGGGLNPTFDPDPLALSRGNFEDPSMSESDLGEFLDTIADEPDFGILYGHTNHTDFTQDRIENTIEMAQERGIEVVTLQEALTRLGVLELDTDNGDDDNGIDDGDDGDDADDDDFADDTGNGIDGTDDDGIFDSIAGGIQSGITRIQSAGSDFVSWLRGLWPF